MLWPRQRKNKQSVRATRMRSAIQKPNYMQVFQSGDEFLSRPHPPNCLEAMELRVMRILPEAYRVYSLLILTQNAWKSLRACQFCGESNVGASQIKGNATNSRSHRAFVWPFTQCSWR
jgi:hypothetical protein